MPMTPADSVDEHGNRTDTCSVCTLVPSVSGWARLMQARCPVHGNRTDDPHAAGLSWDWRKQPDLAQLARAVRSVLRALATSYAAHPDYRPEWAP